METFGKIVFGTLVVIFILVVFSLLAAIPVYFLWNWLMPIIFPSGGIVHSLTFMQAIGVVFLSSCLFKSSSFSSKNKD